MNPLDYIHDDERTARSRAPTEPVRCLEDELLPRLSLPTCVGCGSFLRNPRAKSEECPSCRIRKQHRKGGSDYRRARVAMAAIAASLCSQCCERKAEIDGVCLRRSCMRAAGVRI
jgi:hypothetical protein